MNNVNSTYVHTRSLNIFLNFSFNSYEWYKHWKWSVELKETAFQTNNHTYGIHCLHSDEFIYIQHLCMRVMRAIQFKAMWRRSFSLMCFIQYSNSKTYEEEITLISCEQSTNWNIMFACSYIDQKCAKHSTHHLFHMKCSSVSHMPTHSSCSKCLIFLLV